MIKFVFAFTINTQCARSGETLGEEREGERDRERGGQRWREGGRERENDRERETDAERQTDSTTERGVGSAAWHGAHK